MRVASTPSARSRQTTSSIDPRWGTPLCCRCQRRRRMRWCCSAMLASERNCANARATGSVESGGSASNLLESSSGLIAPDRTCFEIDRTLSTASKRSSPSRSLSVWPRSSPRRRTSSLSGSCGSCAFSDIPSHYRVANKRIRLVQSCRHQKSHPRTGGLRDGINCRSIFFSSLQLSSWWLFSWLLSSL